MTTHSLPEVPGVMRHAQRLRYIVNDAAARCGGTVSSYSGRFMFGQQCVAVTVADPVAFAGYVGALAGFAGDIGVANAVLAGMCWDQFGNDFIVYWPDLRPSS